MLAICARDRCRGQARVEGGSQARRRDLAERDRVGPYERGERSERVGKAGEASFFFRLLVRRYELTPEERRAQYDAFAKRYQEIKAELMATYPETTEAECGKRALEEADEEFRSK